VLTVINHVSTLLNAQITRQRQQHPITSKQLYGALKHVVIPTGTSNQPHEHPTPSYKNDAQHLKNKMDINTTPQPQPSQIPTQHCTAFHQQQAQYAPATRPPMSTFPKWTNTKRKTAIQFTSLPQPSQQLGHAYQSK
jgi:hypothetical protein